MSKGPMGLKLPEWSRGMTYDQYMEEVCGIRKKSTREMILDLIDDYIDAKEALSREKGKHGTE